ncbi:MAG: signal peptide peptidase SppA [bacterium]
MKNRNILIGCGILFFTFFLFVLLVVAVSQSFLRGVGKGVSFKSTIVKKDKVGVIYISGLIHSGGDRTGLFSESQAGSDAVVRALEKGGRDENIRVILLRINSPGGSAAASQEIYNEVLKVRQVYKKPVVISMGDVAASGAFYISAAADTIIANPATITGSIGVIMEYLNMEGLMEKVGLSPVVLKSVEHKDIGSPFRKATDTEQQILQNAINNIHQQFIRDVANGRKIPLSEIEKLADGRFYTGEQAIKLKLIDRVGGYEEALEYAARLGGIPSPPEIEYLQRAYPFFFLSTMEKLGFDFSNSKNIAHVADYLLLSPFIIQN